MTRQRPGHARIHLPPLDPGDALVVVDVLERAIRALWRAHGDAMADRLAAMGIETPMPPDAVYEGNPNADDDTDF